MTDAIVAGWIKITAITTDLRKTYEAGSGDLLSKALIRKAARVQSTLGVTLAFHVDTNGVQLSMLTRKMMSALIVSSCRSWYSLASTVVMVASLHPEDDEMQLASSKIIAEGICTPVSVVRDAVESVRRSAIEMGLGTTRLDELFRT